MNLQDMLNAQANSVATTCAHYPRQKTAAGELPCVVCSKENEIQWEGRKLEKVRHSGRLEWTEFVHPKPESAE